MSQAALGDRLGISFQQIQKYERGINRISASTLYLAAGALSVPPEYFFKGFNDDTYSEITTNELLTATPRAHRIMQGILELPIAVQTRLEYLVDAIRQDASDDDVAGNQ